MLIATWKDRLRKLPPEQLPEGKDQQYELLMPPTSHLPLHFSVSQICPPKPSRRHSDGHQCQKVDSEPESQSENDTINELEESVVVFGLGDDYTIGRAAMNALGIDIGTKNIVVSFRHNKKLVFLREINGYSSPKQIR